MDSKGGQAIRTAATVTLADGQKVAVWIETDGRTSPVTLSLADVKANARVHVARGDRS